ncbi:vegetative cell wall protein gp1-like [Prionailurus viverrinus]|uniref:vegetative cell wall protein gp1-like n=1 Tax=Prionailurus viverrinus TaxID=61388 RepID=UPI001FF44A92|nr:vegetative cell wall protein gp1-like [Prionailurus viverrinus]
MGFSKQDRVTNPPGGTWRAVKGQAQGSLHLEEKDRTPAALRPLEIPRLASETLWPVPTTWSDPNPLLGTPTLRLNRPRPRFELHPAPLDAPSPTHATTPPPTHLPLAPPQPPNPHFLRQAPLPPAPSARPPSAPRPLSSPSPGSTQSSGLTARPVPGAATSARPGPRAVEPPQLRGPGRHPFPRPLPPTPPRLGSGSPPPPRAAPPRPAGAAVSGAAGPSAATAAAAAAAIRDNQGRPEDPDTGLPGPRIRIPGCCGVWSGRAPGKPGTWMKEPNPGSRNARSHGARIIES